MRFAIDLQCLIGSNTLARLRCVGLDNVVWLEKFENRGISRRTFSGGTFFRISFLQLSWACACGKLGKGKTSGNQPES